MLLAGLVLACLAATATAIEQLNITVPSSYKVGGNDAYVCAIVALPQEAHKLVGVIPLADMTVVHHILLYGCELPKQQPEPGQTIAWDCGHHGVCGNGGSQIIYGWGRNAPQFHMPPGVAFSVGGATQMRYIVAQVHFRGSRPANDQSGVQLVLKPQPTPFSAGVITFASGFAIPANTESTKIATECCYSGHQPLRTVAFRVHTHALGRSVYMERPTWNHSGVEVVAVNNPQLPQAFYPVKQQVIWPGDKLKVTCDFDSRGRDRVTVSGATSDDEMCNMYMMVYSPHPFISMCTGGSGPMGTSPNMPGTMPTDGALTLDPCVFWKPPGSSAAAQGGESAGEQGKEGGEEGLGDVTGVAVAGDGGLWAFYRGPKRWTGTSFKSDFTLADPTPIDKPVLVQLDADTGKVVARIGAGLFGMPHMITLDKDGNIWAVDVGLHQVIKMDHKGTVLLRVGTTGVPGKDGTHFCQPTHVAVARDGTFYVADGYCNTRVAKFNADGTYIGEVAIPAPRGPPVVHSVLLDECTSTLYIAARETGTVYIANTDTLQITNQVDMSAKGRVWSIIMGAYGAPLALTWDLNKEAVLVHIQRPDSQWVIPGMSTLFPHQIALGAGPPTLTGAADRLFALYVAPVCEAGCGPLRRYVLVPKDVKLPDVSQVLEPVPLPTVSIPLPSSSPEPTQHTPQPDDFETPQPQQGSTQTQPDTQTPQPDATQTQTPAGTENPQPQEQQPQPEEVPQHHSQGAGGVLEVVDRHTDKSNEYGTVVTASQYTIAMPAYKGQLALRVLALVAFAGIMAVVVGVLTRKMLRNKYGDPSVQGRKGSLDDMIARSAELDNGVEEGTQGQARGSPGALQFRSAYHLTSTQEPKT